MAKAHANPKCGCGECVGYDLAMADLREIIGERSPCSDHDWEISGCVWCSTCDRWIVERQIIALIKAVEGSGDGD